MVNRLAGRLETAWPLACEALDFARQQKARGIETLALIELGALHAGANPPAIEDAVARYSEALTLATELGMRPLIAHCHLGLGKLYRRTGMHEQVQEHLTTATTMYGEMGMPRWREQAEAEMTALG